MKKVLLSVVAAIAITAVAPAFAADMPVKAKKVVVAAPSPWDIAFGTAFTSDYILRGISQSNKRPAIQGYFEARYNVNDMIQLYAGVWGSSLYTGLANAEFDISGGARFTFGSFGLDVGYVYYAYPGPVATILGSASLPGFDSLGYGELYAKPSYKFNDFLSIGGTIIGGGDYGNTGQSAVYYEGNATVTLPAFMPWGIATSLSAALGRQTYSSGYTALGIPGALNITDYTTWNAGVAFNYKAVTLDLRYYDTNIDSTSQPFQCTSTTFSNVCSPAFVATLKFDTTFSALK
jgi:uncharacterized protein (TIGR02001 family)